MKPWNQYAVSGGARPQCALYCEYYFYQYGAIVGIDTLGISLNDLHAATYLIRGSVPELSERFFKKYREQSYVYQIKFDSAQYNRDCDIYQSATAAIKAEFKRDLFEHFKFKPDNKLAIALYSRIGFTISFHEQYAQFEELYCEILNDYQ